MTVSPQTATAFIIAEAKNSEFHTQLKTIFYFLQENIATASMVANATGIPQKNICRFKRDLEKAGLLWEVKKETGKNTGNTAFKYFYFLFSNIKIQLENPSFLLNPSVFIINYAGILQVFTFLKS